MPLLEGPDDSDEIEEEETETQGVVCAVTPKLQRRKGIAEDAAKAQTREGQIPSSQGHHGVEEQFILLLLVHIYYL